LLTYSVEKSRALQFDVAISSAPSCDDGEIDGGTENASRRATVASAAGRVQGWCGANPGFELEHGNGADSDERRLGVAIMRHRSAVCVTSIRVSPAQYPASSPTQLGSTGLSPQSGSPWQESTGSSQAWSTKTRPSATQPITCMAMRGCNACAAPTAAVTPQPSAMERRFERGKTATV
jgi:hypothetical protein